MKKPNILVAICALGAVLSSTSILADPEMARTFRDGTGICVTRLVTPYYTSCATEVYKDEKGSLAFSDAHFVKCATYKGNPDPRAILRDRH